MNADTEALRHRVQQLELLCAELRLKAKRLGLEADHYARLYKQTRMGPEKIPSS